MNDTIVLNSHYASFSRRLGAVLIDGLILIIPAAIMGHVVPVAGGLAAWFLYAPFLESSVLRATIGKKLMGIQVVDLHGGRISFRAAMLRALGKMISSALMCIPHLTALFTDKKQAVHDMVAETTVVYGRVDISPVDAWVDMMREVFRGDGAASPAKPAQGSAADQRLAALERLQALYEKGALTKEEFEAEKAKLLNS